MATDWIELEKEKADRDAIREIIDRTYKKCWSCIHCGKYNNCRCYNKIVGYGKLLDTEGCPHYDTGKKGYTISEHTSSDFAHKCLIAFGIGILLLVAVLSLGH